MHFDDFDWDEGNTKECEKRGLSIAEIEAVLRRWPVIAPDMKHSASEPRFIAVGVNTNGRPVFIAFTLRQDGDETLLRPISARYMHEDEARRYAQQTKTSPGLRV